MCSLYSTCVAYITRTVLYGVRSPVLERIAVSRRSKWHCYCTSGTARKCFCNLLQSQGAYLFIAVPLLLASYDIATVCNISQCQLTAVALREDPLEKWPRSASCAVLPNPNMYIVQYCRWPHAAEMSLQCGIKKSHCES